MPTMPRINRPSFSVGLIMCSNRKPRLNPFVSSYVKSVIESQVQAQRPGAVTIHEIDLGSEKWQLPMVMDEPILPVQLPKDNTSEHYAQATTRAWSAEISKHQAFVFVTPQYNWSFPGPLKVAIDYLFHEWVGKPAMIVTYGGPRGGHQSSIQLAHVLGGGIKMHMTETHPALPCLPTTLKTQGNEGGEDQIAKWRADGKEEEIKKTWSEVMFMLTQEQVDIS